MKNAAVRRLKFARKTEMQMGRAGGGEGGGGIGV